MFFRWEWTETQLFLYGVKRNSWDAFIVAFVAVLTHYATSQWIWFGGRKKTNRPPHRSPVYLVSLLVFAYLWDSMFEFYFLGRTLPLGDQIAIPVVVLAGAPLNLIFCWVWTKVFPQAEDSKEGTKNDSNGSDVVEGAELPTELESAPTKDTADANNDIEVQMEREKERDEIEEGASAVKADVVQPSKPSILYINNIKIYLTNLVIIHHCATYLGVGISTAFIPINGPTDSLAYAVMAVMLIINQSFFMNLFFFFSGYFVPKSFDKKGAYVFIMERAKRLGIPFLAYTFFLGPFCRRIYLQLFYKGTSIGDLPFSFIYEDGPAWFLAQLMIFGIAYAFLCGKGWSPKIACPSMLGFIGIAIVLGLLSAFLTMVFPKTSVMLTPEFWNFYISYVSFFFAGALAQRNNWMESIKTRSRFPIYLFAGVSFCLGVGTLFIFDLPIWVQNLYGGLAVYGGLCTMSFSLAVTVFFMDFVDKKYFFTDFFAKSMYTAYIIHMAIAIPAAAAILVVLYEATGKVEWIERPDEFLYHYKISDGTFQFAAFIFLIAVSMFIAWPLAFCIRSIPGFSQVL